jgi:radical SAM-linked protein
MMRLIRPEKDLAHILPLVQKPGRYTGGEFASLPSLNDGGVLDKFFSAADCLLAGICFPDLYDVGMSNTAVKLIYSQLNAIPGVRCERVFAPAPDFESLLRGSGLSLYTLESGIPLGELDVLGISVGYELSATSILSVLECGGIPLHSRERRDSDPLVIAGGPALTNPAPFSAFLDAVYIGESESSFSLIISSLKEMKTRGGNRQDRLELLMGFPEIWMPQKKETFRGIFTDFNIARLGPVPVPNIRVVQDHGVAEIMRGCPNGCRFCHAGMFYRPFRQKSFSKIVEEIDYFIFDLGYREISLSSLSTGDYEGIPELTAFLNRRYEGLGVSFALPSLKVNSFTLPVLQELSKIRKSGLTFAVETPGLLAQRSINKEAPLDKVVDILKEAGQRGWNMAKFYFMIGLPEHLYEGTEEDDEIDSIAEYLHRVRNETHFKLNVNIGTFIPKPHTPYQWSRQLGEEEALGKIKRLRSEFRKGPVKISYHSPFGSFLEGVISRGDERVGELIEKAYRRGARLDAWEEYISFDLWKQVLAEADWDVEEESLRERELDESLPWDDVDIGVKKEYFLRELEKSKNHTLTEECVFPCTHHCGVCVKNIRPELPQLKEDLKEIPPPRRSIPEIGEGEEGAWYLFLFEKRGKARFLSHINIMTIFERSFQRAGIILEYTHGFNPKPRLDFAQPLSLGIESLGEPARCKILTEKTFPSVKEKDYLNRINENLPEGIKVLCFYPFLDNYASGRGRSLMALFSGAEYEIRSRRQMDPYDLETLFTKLRDFILASGGNTETLVLEKDYLRLFVPADGSGKFSLKALFTEIEGSMGSFLSKYDVLRTFLYMKEKPDRGINSGTIVTAEEVSPFGESYLSLVR